MSAPMSWHPRHLLLAPHRLGFFLGMVLLWAAGLWWALVQLDRVTSALGLAYVLSPSLVHGAVMTFGFIPLFFSGFLFTAGPKWLGVPPPEAPQLLAPLLLQAGGWLLWLAGAHLHLAVGLCGLVMACVGLLWMSALFWRLLARSEVVDTVHALVIAQACGVGCASLLGLVVSVWAVAEAVALACVLTSLWGFVVAVYVAVAHRMIPFFTSSAMPQLAAWRPFWALGLMLAVVVLEVLAVWLDLLQPADVAWGTLWLLLRGTLELAAGAVLLWLAGVWGLVQSLKNRLLTMLHIGFVWLGLALLLAGASQWLSWGLGTPVLPLGALHALTMGCLASLMLAMVTRVSAGHSGRALVADGWVWSLFMLLQVATALRILAAGAAAWAAPMLAVVACGWFAVMALWGGRLVGWYGRRRSDGRPG
ncbi:short-chain dehydrogenase [Rhodoferax sp. TH121]|nr:short-chain dehydrogenase [Rhodoferax sp. TH121]